METTTTTPDMDEARYCTERLYTDTRCWEIVARTPKTITVRPTQDVGEPRSENRDGNPYPCVYYPQGPNPEAPTYVLRQRKDGTYRFGDGGSPLRPTDRPETFIDYRY